MKKNKIQKEDKKYFYTIFATAIGDCGLVWWENKETLEMKVARFFLPEENIFNLEQKIKNSHFPLNDEMRFQKRPQVIISEWIENIKKFLITGQDQSLQKIVIDDQDFPPFFQTVYQQLRKVSSGQVISYAELAKKCSCPGGARAVGQAMRKNPLPLIIPCHRVIASQMKKGGFSAFGGINTKIQLLKIEGITLS